MIKYFNLQLFAEISPINTTQQSSMNVSWKTFYDTTLLENAKENNVFDQFGMKQPIKGGKVEWRRFNTFSKALTPLTEGIVPTGQSFGMTSIEGTVTQHGDYTTLTDRVQAEMYDDFVFGATEEMGVAMGETKDTLTRNVLVAGNSVLYCPKADGTEVNSRTNLDNECILTPAVVHRAATWLIKNKAPKINGWYVAIIHPSVAHDLMETEEWKKNHYNTNPTPIFKGEIGELYGVRFVVSNNAKIWKESTGPAKYATLFLGHNAYGVIEPDGEGAEMIIKQKEEIGGPLNQFSTIGFKFVHGVKILYQERMLRVESGSSFGSVDEAN